MSDQNPTPAESRTNLPWFKKKAIVIPLGVLVFIIVLNATRGPVDGTSAPESSDSSNSIATDEPIATLEPEVTQEPEPEVTEEPEPEGPVETLSQSNAVSTAQDYIEYQSFSRSGLIEQLKYEGFSSSDAAYAVDTIYVNWNEQAAKTAQNYLDTSSFSASGLYDQLIYEGFSPSQANFGLDAVGY
jgi:hypothetical protein